MQIAFDSAKRRQIRLKLVSVPNCERPLLVNFKVVSKHMTVPVLIRVALVNSVKKQASANRVAHRHKKIK
jgi:hypothetical protein